MTGCLLLFGLASIAVGQLLLDENVLSFPVIVRRAHGYECSPLRTDWIFCDNFEIERPGAYIEPRHRAQRRVLGENREKKLFFILNASCAFLPTLHDD
jgi:hypothetical protein